MKIKIKRNRFINLHNYRNIYYNHKLQHKINNRQWIHLLYLLINLTINKTWVNSKTKLIFYKHNYKIKIILLKSMRNKLCKLKINLKHYMKIKYNNWKMI
jgi:hypothetical protein